jgi:hypothetical protein
MMPLEAADRHRRTRRRDDGARVRLGVGDLPRLHPVADGARRRTRLHIIEAAQFLAEIFFELVEGESKLIAALERKPLALAVDVGSVDDGLLARIDAICRSPAGARSTVIQSGYCLLSSALSSATAAPISKNCRGQSRTAI